MLDRFVRRAVLSSFVATLALIATPREARAGSSCIPGFNYGAFAKGCDLVFNGGSVTDSFDSTLGTYATTKTNTGGNIGTNGTANNCVRLNGATTDINGNIDVGPGGVPSSVISGAGSFDSASALTAPVSLPSVTIPTTYPNAVPFNVALTGGSTTLAPNLTYGDVSVAGGGTIILESGEYVMNSFRFTGNSILSLTITTGPVIVYIKTDLDISGGTVTNGTGKSTNLIFMLGPACATAKISGGASATYAVYGPDTDIDLVGGSDIFGAVVGKTVKDSGGTDIHYDKALATATGGGFTCPPTEVSRSSPIAAIIEGSAATSIVQGSFEAPTGSQPTFSTVAQLASWSFPYIKGHLRARVASTITAGSFSSGTVLFDAGATGNIPTSAATCGAPMNTSCRYVFTNTNTANPLGLTYLPTVTTLDDGNASTVGALMTSALTGFGASEWSTIVQTVRGGKLGGVDRSTVFVVEAGSIVGTTRSTIAYFGATDGMLHAVCASTGTAACPAGSLGKELWAFMPRVQLPLVPGNTTRVDGSVRVVDVFGNFPTAVAGSPASPPTAATGRRSFRTILLFHTGFGIGTKDAAYAFDITDPQKPVLLWEYVTPAAPASIDFGTGMRVAAGPVVIDGVTRNLAVFETNNGGTTSTTTNGIAVTALEIDVTASGTRPVWQFTHAYPSPPRGVAGDAMPVPPQSAPGGAAPVDINNTGEGLVTHFVMGDLYGSLWKLAAATGTPELGAGFTCGVADSSGTVTSFSNTCSPIFSFTTNKHPIGSLPAIFARTSGGAQYIGFASGGYVDPVATLWTTTTQNLIAVKVAPSSIPINEGSGTSTSGDLLISSTFANANEKVFAAAQIVGTKLLITTDDTDVNLSTYGTGGSNTGRIYSVDIAGGATSGTLTVVASGMTGAGSVANDSGGNKAYFGGGNSTASSLTGGVTLDPSSSVKLTRRLWLRGQKG